MSNTVDNIPNMSETPTPVMGVPIVQQRVGSPSFMMAVSIIIGIVIGCGVIVGALGRAFFVGREEYTAKELKDVAEKGQVTSELKQTLERLNQSVIRQEEAMANQKAAFEKLSDMVHSMKWDMRGKAR